MVKKKLKIDTDEFEDLDDGGEIVDEYDPCDDIELLNSQEIVSIENDLRNFIVPFLSAETEKKAIKIYNDYHRQNSLEKESNPKTILKFRDIISAMLKIAILGKQGQELPDDLTNMISPVEECIEKAFTTEKPQVFWRGKEGTWQLPALTSSDDKNGFGPMSYSWFRELTLSFHRMPGAEVLSSFGYDIVGICLNCGAFFKKNRKDQKYCKKNCKSASAMRRRYQKKNKP